MNQVGAGPAMTSDSDEGSNTLGLVNRIGKVEGRVYAIEGRLEKNDGLLREVRDANLELHDFVVDHKAKETERDKLQATRHQENVDRNRKLNSKLVIYGTIIAFFGLVCAVCMLVLAFKAAQHATLDPAHIFHSQREPDLAKAGQQLAF